MPRHPHAPIRLAQTPPYPDPDKPSPELPQPAPFPNPPNLARPPT
jgi:hypothetical protein